MRVEITYKFVMGFIIVVASIVALNYLVPAATLVPHYMEQTLSTACALLVGLLLGWIFPRPLPPISWCLKRRGAHQRWRSVPDRVSANNMLPTKRLNWPLLSTGDDQICGSLSGISARHLPR